jgi:hypothetical protein
MKIKLNQYRTIRDSSSFRTMNEGRTHSKCIHFLANPLQNLHCTFRGMSHLEE